jgi:hypothetical protein
MATKKTSGGDSPLRQGARKSLWTLPISGRRRRWIAMCFWKIDQVLRFFLSVGLYRRRGEVRSGASGLTPGWRGPGAGRAGLACGPLMATLLLPFGSLEASDKNKTFGFCFVEFREYFLCSFSETQK